jgi:hypothetical protein
MGAALRRELNRKIGAGVFFRGLTILFFPDKIKQEFEIWVRGVSLRLIIRRMISQVKGYVLCLSLTKHKVWSFVHWFQ